MSRDELGDEEWDNACENADADVCLMQISLVNDGIAVARKPQRLWEFLCASSVCSLTVP